MNKNEIPEGLKEKLDEFHVTVPDIPLKRSRLERVTDWIYTPAKNPLELLEVKGDPIKRLVFLPLVTMLIFSAIPMFFII